MESTLAAQGAALTAENGVYDNDGDLTLFVGQKMTRFRVCSKTLARSSPVFKRMLCGNFAESRPSDGTNWVFSLPEDGARAMAIFLSIIHGKFHVTPETLSVRDLYDLLTLTEKYDATALLRPFAHRWIDAVGSQMDDPYLLCVAWELGHIELFEKLMVAITRDCTVNEEGMLLYGRPTNELSTCTSDATAYLDPDKELETYCSFEVNSMSQRTTHLDNSWTFLLGSIFHLQPDNMIETIKRNRMVLVQEYLRPYLTLYDALARGRCTVDLGRREHLTSIEEHSACDAMAFGSLFKAFQSLGSNMVGHDATAKMTTPTEAKVYDKDGYLTLCVGPTETLYQVCPDSLARASPVFKKMLFGGFAESRPAAGDWAVDLPEDDSEAMEIFLGMVHSRFEMVPKTLPVAKLYALLTLTNKYDATALIQPWA
ncbi:nuclear pore protein-like protein [Colletotrichum camelliae]|nr:nuclear pore protein-like protein [Colletotrichum camelliae]